MVCQAKTKGTQKISFAEFEHALELIAEKKVMCALLVLWAIGRHAVNLTYVCSRPVENRVQRCMATYRVAAQLT